MTADAMLAAAGGGTTDSQNPWPGLAAYQEKDEHFFHGRETDVERLRRLVSRERLTVLFSASGLGKTSLLRAGLFPRLRRERQLPVYVRLDYNDRRSLVDQIKGALAREAQAAGIDAPEPCEPETLWEYFHRRNAKFWDQRNEIVIPLLVLDQFEETLRQGQDRPADRAALLEQLGDLIEGRVPEPLKDAGSDLAESFSLDLHDYKVLLSLREDFLANLEDLRPEIRSIVSNRLRLQRMSGEDALRALEAVGGHLFEDGVAPQTVRFLAGSRGEGDDLAALEVEPSLLSLICRELNQERQLRGQPRITADQLERDRTRLLSDFYENSFAGLSPAVRILVEDKLVTESGDRDSMDLGNAVRTAGVGQEAITELQNRRLLRIDDRGGRPRIELTHDVLTGVARASREARRERRAREEAEAARRAAEQRGRLDRRRSRQKLLFLGLLVVLAIAMAAQFELTARANGAAEAREETARRIVQRALLAPTVALVETGQVARALAFLAQAMKSNPDNPPARSLALDLLLRRPWALRLATMKHEGTVYWAELSRDGGRVATASRDGTARIWDAATGRLLCQLRHDQAVHFVRFSPDGRRVVTASADHTARVWDATTCKPVALLRHEDSVYSGEFSPDGRRVVTASEDKTVRVWDAVTGSQQLQMAHAGGVYYARFNQRGDRIASASRDHTAGLWDAATGQRLFTLQHGDEVQMADFSADDLRLVTASRDRTARVWDTATGRAVGLPMQHRDWVQVAVFDLTARRVVTASLDGTAQVWDAATGQPIGLPMKHDDFVQYACFSPDGGRVVTASQDGTARLWDAATGEPRSEPLAHDGEVDSATFSPDGRLVVTASEDGSARLWDVRAEPAAATRLLHHEAVTSARFSPDGRLVLTTTVDGSARAWDAGSGADEGKLRGGEILAARFGEDSRPLVATARDGNVEIRNVRTGAAVGPPLRHGSGRVDFALLSASGKVVLTASANDGVKVWESQNGSLLSSWRQGEITAADLSADGSRAAAASGTVVEIHDARTGRRVGEPLEHGGRVAFCNFSSSGAQLATRAGLKAEIVRLWDTATGRPLGLPLRHRNTVESVEFSPDGERIVTACEDGAARVWQVRTGQLVGEPMRHGRAKSEDKKTVYSASFSPDGLRIVTAALDGTARVWDAATGQPLGSPLPHDGPVRTALFSPDGQRVATASGDGTARLWDVPTGTKDEEDILASWAETAGGYQVNTMGAAVPVDDAPARLARLREQAALPAGQPGSVRGLLRWFLTDPAVRAISPLSRVKTQQTDPSRSLAH